MTIKEAPKETSDAFELAMGGWRRAIDCEKLIKDIYKSRQLSAKRFPEWGYCFGNKFLKHEYILVIQQYDKNQKSFY